MKFDKIVDMGKKLVDDHRRDLRPVVIVERDGEVDLLQADDPSKEAYIIRAKQHIQSHNAKRYYVFYVGEKINPAPTDLKRDFLIVSEYNADNITPIKLPHTNTVLPK